MSVAKNRNEVYLEEIIDNLNGNLRTLPVDCKPRTREEVLLSEIEKNTRALQGSSSYSMWVGTQSEYDNLDVKDANTLYFIKDEV